MVVIPAHADGAAADADAGAPAASCTTSPTPSATRSSRCSPTGPTPTREHAARRRRAARRGACSASTRSTRAIPVDAGGAAAFHRAAPRAPLQRNRAALDRLGAQARQARAADRGCWPTGSAPPPFVDLGDVSRLAAGIALRAHARQRHRAAARAPARAGRRGRAPAQPAAARRRRRAAWSRGYGILQPRVATPLPRARATSRSTTGCSPASAASTPTAPPRSEVYQDLFGEGTLHRQGPLNVQAVHAVLGGRLPEGQVLSHDLLEGSLARCAAVTDVTVIEDAPFHADVAASRVHRWTRGDWQLLPFLLQPAALPACAPSTAGRCSTTCAARWSRRCRWRCCAGAGQRRRLAVGGAGAGDRRVHAPGR